MPSFDILGNVIPGIGGGEEEKIETTANKISTPSAARQGRRRILNAEPMEAEGLL